MRRSLALVIALLAARIPATAADSSGRNTGPWDLAALYEAPEVTWIDRAGPIQSLCYAGEPFRDHPTRVFAYFALPERRDGKVPGMVLVHGGGGKAFREWVELWMRRGYAAIAMDLAGKGADGKPLPDGGPDQGDGEKFEAIAGGVRAAWPYHAVASVIRAVSLMRSLPEVDPSRVGITGISWGGYLTTIVAGLDDRLAAAVPVYGCGFLHDNSVWAERIAKMPEAERKLWIETFDPSRYLGGCRIPILFINGTNDFAYPLDSYQKSYRLVRGPRTLSIRVGMPHGHPQGWAPEEIGIFIDSILKEGDPLPAVEAMTRRGRDVTAAFSSKVPVERAFLHATVANGPWQKREWTTVPASIEGDRICAALALDPATAGGPIAYYMTLADARGAIVSTEHDEIPCAPPHPVLSRPVLEEDDNIRNYLMRAASEVTRTSLDGIRTLGDWQAVRAKRYDEFLEMMSLTDVPVREKRDPPPVNIVGVIRRDGYRIVRLWYESLPKLYVPANLYVPEGAAAHSAAAVIYVCGHARTQKVAFQPWGHKFAKLGFVCLIPETIQWGEVLGMHWGCYASGQFQWYSRGYTPGGVELWNAMRGVDLLSSLPEVDPQRIGVTGISGGGAYSWYLAAADPRIKVAAPVCGTGTVEAHIHQRTIDGHCDCMMPVNTYLRDYHDIGALIAPRPLMIASADRDGLYSIESVRACHARVKRIYDLYGAGGECRLVETPGGHSYHAISRTRIFSFFAKHLQGREIPPEAIGDIDASEEAQLSADDLRVYVDGPPADDRTLTIQESFQTMAAPPAIGSLDALKAHRERVVSFLREKTFRSFPATPPDLAMRLEFRASGKTVYSFLSEEGWRLALETAWDETDAAARPLLLVLRSPGEKRWEAEGFAGGLAGGWRRAFFAARGIGETGWAPDLQWHLRRAAAWTGRTIASMRVYDVLRAIEAARSVSGVGDRIAIAARGEMAAIALYAALLDGRLHAVILQDPPATQNAPSAEDGKGEAIEMLNCLRITDLPQVAGLLAPARVVFIGEPPATYGWARETCEAIGRPEDVIVVKRIADWRP
ncbi:MAG: acetylxylan esterase [Planctomycetes bacterium]|nr:acetylxylan esterase [Planctomycetota bacterium]